MNEQEYRSRVISMVRRLNTNLSSYCIDCVHRNFINGVSIKTCAEEVVMDSCLYDGIWE